MAQPSSGPNPPPLTPIQSLAIAGQFGVSLAIAVGLGLLVGHWLDAQLGTGIVLTLVGVLLGLVAASAGVVSVYRGALARPSARHAPSGDETRDSKTD